MGGWVQVLLGFFCLENRTKIALNQYSYFLVVYHVYSVCIYKVVSYYDLNVLSMSVMGFHNNNKLDGVGGWGELCPGLFRIF